MFIQELCKNKRQIKMIISVDVRGSGQLFGESFLAACGSSLHHMGGEKKSALADK